MPWEATLKQEEQETLDILGFSYGLTALDEWQ
ncbi:MAG: hypothetical protein KatS3mg067_0225 [Thermosynechococcus sp.]|nr:MAG: hypothetical protein KatS3mg067_0225 [Thermosynechococcus sp.]